MGLKKKFVSTLVAIGGGAALAMGSMGVAHAIYFPDGNGELTVVLASANGGYTKGTMVCFPNTGYDARATVIVGGQTRQSAWKYGVASISHQVAGAVTVTGTCDFT
ncbi:MAG: hypothetical protein LBJ44_02120 [Propionibacteriaceae bacterium]|jgi:hypothetical protein|nr:hypothetical protein [Propionibacteriaceae bacterium]